MTAAVCSAQSITSARSGTLHYFDGDVSIDGAPIQQKVGRFAEIKESEVLRTGQGRAEVLLTPGVFLRVGENSAIRMIDNRLVSTRVEIVSGNAVVESDDPQVTIKDSPFTLIYKDYQIQFVKHGLLEIGSDPAELKVYQGEAIVTTTDNRVTVKEGRMLPFSAALLTEKFNDKVGDDLYLWARDRSQSISAANMSSARSLNSMGYGAGLGYAPGYGSGNWGGGWYYNPYFNMYTYVPGGGMFMNGFGYGFFSPSTIYSYYTPSNYWYGGGTSIGQPLAGIVSRTTGQPASLNTLRSASGAGSNIPTLGSPLRNGSVIGATSSAGGSSASSASSSARAGGSAFGGGGGGARVSAGGGGHSGGGHR
jgi:hypothetical protein